MKGSVTSALVGGVLVGALFVGGNTLAGAAPPAPPPPSQPVTVTNTSDQPVPVAVTNAPATQAVSGTVTVANLPATQNIAGTVTVANLPATQNIAGTVTVANDPAPFQVEADGRLDEQFPTVSFQVPAGTRLLVDYLSVHIAAYNGSINPTASISGTHGGQFTRFFEHLDSAPASYGTSYGTQHEVRMSFDAGSTVSLSVTRTSGTDGLIFFNVHGELIPV